MINKGIITAIDSNCFSAFQLFNYSLKRTNNEIPLLVFDLGLNKKEIEWTNKNSINLKKYKKPIIPKNIFMWQTWNKPDYIRKSPFEYTLWLDSDILIYEKIDELFDLLKNKIVCVKDFSKTNTNNNKKIYEMFPVKEKLKSNCNGGVLGICKTRKKDIYFLREWILLTKKAAESEEIRNNLKWWDQGAINWALEKTKNIDVVIDDRNLNNLTSNYKVSTDPIILYESLRAKKSKIVHFAGCPKPYFWFEKKLDRSPIEKNLKIFVLGHKKEQLEKIPQKKFISTINLSNLNIQISNNKVINTQDLAENKFFLSDHIFRSQESFIGIITHRYKQKYDLDIENLFKLKNRLEMSCVYTCHTARKDWYEYTINYHPGIDRYLKEISYVFNLPIRKKNVFWANNFICHKSIFAEFALVFRQIFHYMHEKYGYNFDYKVDSGQEHRRAAFLYERISMMYFSNQDNLDIIQIPYAKSGFDQLQI